MFSCPARWGRGDPGTRGGSRPGAAAEPWDSMTRAAAVAILPTWSSGPVRRGCPQHPAAGPSCPPSLGPLLRGRSSRGFSSSREWVYQDWNSDPADRSLKFRGNVFAFFASLLSAAPRGTTQKKGRQRKPPNQPPLPNEASAVGFHVFLNVGSFLFVSARSRGKGKAEGCWYEAGCLSVLRLNALSLRAGTCQDSGPRAEERG